MGFRIANLISCQKIFGFLFVLVFHAAVLWLLLSDRVTLPLEQVGRSTTVTVLQAESRQPAKISLVPLDFKSPPVFVDPPVVELPLGKPVPPQPMVVIGAKFSPEVALSLPAANYPDNLRRLTAIYRARVSVQIFENGYMGEAFIESSDGSSELDRFIIDYANSHWHFLPSSHDGVAVVSWQNVYVEITPKEMTVRF